MNRTWSWLLSKEYELLILILVQPWNFMSTGGLDLAVPFTPSTPNLQNRNQMSWNICAGVRRSTPSSEVVKTEQSRDMIQNKMAEHCLHCTEIFFLVIHIEQNTVIS